MRGIVRNFDAERVERVFSRTAGSWATKTWSAHSSQLNSPCMANLDTIMCTPSTSTIVLVLVLVPPSTSSTISGTITNSSSTSTSTSTITITTSSSSTTTTSGGGWY